MTGGNSFNILSLFDGMSCGRIAADRAGITVDKYYAAEIDKYAIKVSQANYPDTAQLGSVTEWRNWDIDWSSIDLLIGGSPCQGFSFAGKQLAFDDPRSMLFFEYVNILNHIRSFNPDVKFMLENVSMKQEYLDVISKLLGVKPVFINSSLVSAQNRQRWYWCNWNVEQPEDKGIILADILEDGVTDRDKSFCIDANYFKGGTLEQYFEKHRRQLIFDNNKCIEVGMASINAKDICKRVYSVKGKSPTLTAVQGGHQEKKIAISKTNWRKLTPTECERLQTVPDSYTAHVSNTQRYRMLGNGWTVDVIAHIFKQLLVDNH